MSSRKKNGYVSIFLFFTRIDEGFVLDLKIKPNIIVLYNKTKTWSVVKNLLQGDDKTECVKHISKNVLKSELLNILVLE